MATLSIRNFSDQDHKALRLRAAHRGIRFDRLIMAIALEYGAELASVDEMFKRYPEVTGRLI